MEQLDYILNHGDLHKCFKETEAKKYLKSVKAEGVTDDGVDLEVETEYMNGKTFFIFKLNDYSREVSSVSETTDFYHSAEEAVESIYDFLKSHGV